MAAELEDQVRTLIMVRSGHVEAAKQRNPDADVATPGSSHQGARYDRILRDVGITEDEWKAAAPENRLVAGGLVQDFWP